MANRFGPNGIPELIVNHGIGVKSAAAPRTAERMRMALRRRREGSAGRAGSSDAAGPRPVSPVNALGQPRPHLAPWWEAPAPWWIVALLACAILAGPAWMLEDELRYFHLFGDDFAYIADSRTLPATWHHLLEPHNTHVVPLFRIWTFVLSVAAGRLADMPCVFAIASYFGLVVAMLFLGHFVARETGRTAVGLAAMAILGLSTVTHTAVTWFSAGQALWAGTAIVATLLLARSWCERGGTWRLALVAIGTVLAPAVWSGGLIAGPAAIAYLWVRQRAGARGAIALLGIVTIVPVLVVLVLSQRHLQATPIVWEHHQGLLPRPIQALLHSAQALVESCLFGNFGLVAITTPRQALAVLVVLGAFWAWTRGGFRGITPLEAAGATVAMGSCVLVYVFRGNLPYSSLRSLGWYHAIPEMGAIVFAAGWWSALNPRQASRPSPGEASVVAVLVVLFGFVQLPRGEELLLQGAPPYAPNEAAAFPTTELRIMRALYYKEELRDRQIKTLDRLDRVDAILARVGASPDSLRKDFGRVLVPGIPEEQRESDAFSILKPRSERPGVSHELAGYRLELAELLEPLDPRVPPWLNPNEPLSRAVRETQKKPRAPAK
jgi:hypothetical protein